MSPEIAHLSLDNLLEHFLTTRGKGELYELVPLLIIAAGTKEKVNSVLQLIRDEGKTLNAYYPEFDKGVPVGEYIGEIDDGALYFV